MAKGLTRNAWIGTFVIRIWYKLTLAAVGFQRPEADKIGKLEGRMGGPGQFEFGKVKLRAGEGKMHENEHKKCPHAYSTFKHS